MSPMTREIAKLLLLLAVLVLPIQRASADDAKHLFILSGQSNMRGPLPESFRDAVSAVFGAENVIVVTHARPSQPIKRWYRAWQPPTGMTDEHPEQNGTLYDELMQAVQRATRKSEIASVTYIWMQGEADAGHGWGSVYEASFMGVLDQLKQDLQVDDINFVVGRINDYWLSDNGFVDGDLVRNIQQQLGEQHDNGAWINTDDLNRGVNPWGGYSFNDGHFPPAGYRVMGQRFARQACRLIDSDIELDEAIFREAFFDTSDDIATHAGVQITAAVSGPAPDRSAAGGGFAVLIDGRFGQLDAQDDTWVGYAPREGTVWLTVYLDEPTAIDSVAVNLLVNEDANAGLPARIRVSVSPDGEEDNYRQVNDRHCSVNFASRPFRDAVAAGLEPQTLLVLTDQNQTVAQAIRFEIEFAGQWVLIDELVINPSAQAQP